MSNGVVQEHESGTLLRVTVKPRSQDRDLVTEIGPNGVVVSLNSAARGGRANRELIKRIAKAMGTSSGEVILVSGHKSKEKVLLIAGKKPDHVLEVLNSLVNV